MEKIRLGTVWLVLFCSSASWILPSAFIPEAESTGQQLARGVGERIDAEVEIYTGSDLDHAAEAFSSRTFII